MISIAIDGPSGSGKSTVSKVIANELGFMCVDTGALYRAVAYFVEKSGIDPENEQAVLECLKKIDLKVKNNFAKQEIILKGKVLEKELRTPGVTKISPIIAKYECVRKFLLGFQRELAKNHDTVLDGRDIGTVVLPNADVKIFLTASPEIRAKRRFEQMRANGIDADYDNILESIRRRDHEDKTRKISPLKKADDAVLVDSSNYDLDQTINKILDIIKEKIGGIYG